MDLIVGDHLPPLRLPGVTNPSYVVDSAGGRYLLIAALSRASEDEVLTGIEHLEAARHRFNDVHACAFGIVPDQPRWRERCQDQVPGLRWLFDPEGVGATTLDAESGPAWFLIDPSLVILRRTGMEYAARILENVSTLPPPDLHTGSDIFAPVLVAPRIFEPAFCQALIDEYQRIGGRPSGFMREVDGMTRLINDPNHKRRSDVMLPDGMLRDQAGARIQRRLVPLIHKAFHFRVTRMERYLVACYDAETGGHFRRHRDNTTKGTAHRRFAVSINLNHDFDGGNLCFPEYGNRTYRPPVGGAVVFSCSLLHEATTITRGTRYAFVPFLYDEAAAEIRRANLKFLDTQQAETAMPDAPVDPA